MGTRISSTEFLTLIRDTIPLAKIYDIEVIELDYGKAILRMAFNDSNLRAGGTLNGPTMMTLADTALYAAVLSQVGLEGMALTSTLAFHFLRRPQPAALIAEASVIKEGGRSATGLVHLFSEGSKEPICFASGSYSLP